MAIKYASSLAAGGGDGSFGDPFTLAELIADTHAAGDDLRIIADGTYSRSATWTFSTSGSATSNIRIRGCESSGGTVDGTKATLQASAGSITLLTVTGNHVTTSHLTFDGNSQTSTAGFYQSGTYSRAHNVKAINCTGYGLQCNQGNSNKIHFGEASGCSGTAAIYAEGGANILYCNAHDNTTIGYKLDARSTAIYCIADSNSGSSSHGFLTNSVNYSCVGCIAYANGGNGFNLDGNAGFGVYLDGCISYGNGGEGYGTDGVKDGVWLRHCAGGGNTGGNYSGTNLPNVDNFVSLSADPFVDSSGSDFNINDTAGGGAALRGETLTI